MVGLGVSMQPLQAQPNLDDMFLNEDSDSFDPGLPIGTDFPLSLIHISEPTRPY